MTHEVTTGSIFDDLDYDPGKAEQLKLKAALFDTIIDYMKTNKLTHPPRLIVKTSPPNLGVCSQFPIGIYFFWPKTSLSR